MQLIDQYFDVKKRLDSKDLFTGIWNLMETSGSTPNSREGAAGCIVGNNIYIFGGFSRDIFSDLRLLDQNEQKWKVIEPNQLRQEKPSARFNHSMMNYNNRYLIVFGGAGTYLKSVKMRLCLNDLFFFDLNDCKWREIPEQDLTPAKRMNHVADRIGSLMFIHGGSNNETRKILDDCCLFDILSEKWIQCEYDEFSDKIGARQMHTIQAVYDKDWYDMMSVKNDYPVEA